MNFDKFMRIPFKSQGRDYNGCDCWGLLRLVYEDHLNIVLRSYDEVPAENFEDIAKLMAMYKEEWISITSGLQTYDVVMMRTQGRFKPIAAHVGIMINQREFIHTEQGIGPRKNRIDEPFVRNRIFEYRRHPRMHYS